MRLFDNPVIPILIAAFLFTTVAIGFAQTPPAGEVNLEKQERSMRIEEAKYYQLLSERQAAVLLKTQQALSQREKDWAAYSDELWKALEALKTPAISKK